MKNVGTTTSAFPSSVTTGDPGIENDDLQSELLALADRIDVTPAYTPKDFRSLRTPILYQCDNIGVKSTASVILVNSAHREKLAGALRASASRACNSHDDLVKALRDIEELSDNCVNAESYGAEDALEDLQAIRSVLKRALAKAKA